MSSVGRENHQVGGKHNHPWLVIAMAAIAPAIGQAATWNNLTAGQSWGTSGNWTGGVPNSTTAIADFSTLNPTADYSVAIEAATTYTLNSIIFGDTDPASAANWTIAAGTGGKITLGGASPTITVNALGTNKTATMNVVLQGSAGLTKAGSGTLLLYLNNSYTGGTNITGGTLKLNGASALSSGGVTMSSGTTLNLNSKSISNTVDVGSGGSVTFYAGAAATMSGAITGSSQINVTGYDLNVLTFSSAASTFSGGLNIDSSGGSLTVKAGSANQNVLGSGNITFGNAAAAGKTFTLDLNGNSPTVGLLSGTGARALGRVTTGVAGSTRLTLSGTGSQSFNGIISDGSGTVALKLASGSQTLAGDNTYSGVTDITGGKLYLSGAGAISNSSAVVISAGATLDTTAKTGGFTALASQTLRFELDSANAGSAGLLQAGALNIANAKVDFTTVGTLDDTAYVIAKYSSLTGTEFAQITNLPAGAWIDYNYEQGNQIAVVVPEPAAVVLLGAGIVAAMSRRRRAR